jgi:pyrroline-5-carboxylate reductase
MTTVTFVGGGNMARALASGLREDPAMTLRAGDPDAAQREALTALGVTTCTSNDEAVAGADAIVLAVKPQILLPVIRDLAAVRPQQLVISIAAGVPVAAIRAGFEGTGERAEAPPIVRAMPNTPALLRQGITGLYASRAVSPAQHDLAAAVLGAVGKVHWVQEESLLDAVTAVSGSGPAYFFYLLEAMISTGIELGLEPALAHDLATETALGAARMAREAGEDPGTLRRNVTSPGGTTEAAINTMDQGKVAQVMHQALASAAARAQEMAKEFS